MYQYDPSAGPMPPGFSAINLSVKVGAQLRQNSSEPPSPPATGGPVMDLSTSNASPRQPTSPSVRSPEAVPRSPQTLDLSVARLPHRSANLPKNYLIKNLCLNGIHCTFIGCASLKISKLIATKINV